MERLKIFGRLISVFLACLMVAGTVPVMATETDSADDLFLYPAPRNIAYQSGTFSLTDGYIESDDPSLKAVDKIYSDVLELTEVNLKDNTGVLAVKLEKDDTLNEQGYSLFIESDGIKIKYKDEQGAYWAAATLYQILWQAKTNLPYLTIENDHPDFKFRAFDMDISSNRIPKLETLKSIVDTMSGLKFNQFFLYLEGYSYAYESCPDAWENAVPLSPKEIKELTEYAKERYIELIPAQNSLGHSAKVVSTYPSLGDTPSGQVLNVFKPETQEYLSNIYDDLYDGFDTGYLQVGGDETTFDIANGTAAKSWKELNPEKEPDNNSVYLDSMKVIYDLAKEKGKTMMYWSDMIVRYEVYDIAKEMMPDAIAMNWCYYAGTAGYTRFDYSSKGLSGAGIPFYVCPGDQSWSTIVGNTSELRANAQNAAIKGKQYGAIGYCMTNWGDGGHYQNLITTYPGLAYAGGLSWCYDTNTNDVNSYDKYLNMFVYQDKTNTVSQGFSKIADYKKDSGLTGDIPKCMMNDTWNSLNSSSFLWKSMNTNGDSTIDVTERDALIEKCEKVSGDIEEFLDILSKSDMQSKEKDLLYKEFKNTAQTLKITVDYMAIRAKMLTGGSITAPVSGFYELSDDVMESADEFAEVIEDFRYIWGQRDLVNNLSSTQVQFKNISTFFKTKLGFTNTYYDNTAENLFLMTPDTIGWISSAAGGVSGTTTWTNSGIFVPSVTVSQIGGTTVEQLKKAEADKALHITDDSFVYDAKAAVDGGYYSCDSASQKLMPVVGFPAIIPADGKYKFSVRAKYKSGKAVNTDTVMFSGYANKTSGSGVMTFGDTADWNISAPDKDGWYNVEIEFNAENCQGASLNLLPDTSVTDDELRVADYRLTCSEISKVVISSFHEKTSTVYVGEEITVPGAVSNGKEKITITAKTPSGSEKTVAKGDKIKIEGEGAYTLTYTSDDAAEPLVITFNAEYAYRDLQKLIDKAEAMDLSKYTAETIAALNTEIAEAKAVIADKTSTRADFDAAMTELEKARSGLKLKRTFVDGSKITVTANNDVWKTFVLSNCVDGKEDTYTYIADYQIAGDYIQFEFSEPVTLDGVQIINNQGNDYLGQGEFQVSTNGEDWEFIGNVASTADQTIDFDATEISYARIICTKDVRYWWKLSEVRFYIHVPDSVSGNYIVSGMSVVTANAEDKYTNSYNDTYPMTNVIDGKKDTMGANAYYFKTAGASSKSITVIDLGDDYLLKAVEVSLPSTAQITEAFNLVTPVSTYKKMNENGAGLYVSNTVPKTSDFSGFDIADTSTAEDLVRLTVGGDKLSYGNWDPETRGTGVCNELPEGKTYRYLTIWTPFGGGHALNEIKVKVGGKAEELPAPYVKAEVKESIRENDVAYAVTVIPFNFVTMDKYILAGFRGGVLEYFSKCEFGKGNAEFAVPNSFDEIKVMVWEDDESLKPVCKSLCIPKEEFLAE